MARIEIVAPVTCGRGLCLTNFRDVAVAFPCFYNVWPTSRRQPSEAMASLVKIVLVDTVQQCQDAVAQLFQECVDIDSRVGFNVQGLVPVLERETCTRILKP